jgi:hypothetical protein
LWQECFFPDKFQEVVRNNIKVKVKGKIVPVITLTEHHTMKAYRGVDVQLYSFFDLSTRWR